MSLIANTDLYSLPVLGHTYDLSDAPKRTLFGMPEIVPSFILFPAICPGPFASRNLLLLTCRMYWLLDVCASVLEITFPLYLVALDPFFMNLVAKRPSPAPGIEETLTSQLSRSPDMLCGKDDGAAGVDAVGGGGSK